MSDDVSIKDTDCLWAKRRLAFAKGRLADGLRIVVGIQAVALFVAVLGLSFHSIGIVLDNIGWEAYGMLFVFLGILVSICAASLGLYFLEKLQSVAVEIYSIGCALIFLAFFPLSLLLPFASSILWFSFLCAVPLFFGLIPQFLIARWLAKEAEKGMMQAVENDAMDSERS